MGQDLALRPPPPAHDTLRMCGGHEETCTFANLAVTPYAHPHPGHLGCTHAGIASASCVWDASASAPQGGAEASVANPSKASLSPSCDPSVADCTSLDRCLVLLPQKTLRSCSPLTPTRLQGGHRLSPGCPCRVPPSTSPGFSFLCCFCQIPGRALVSALPSHQGWSQLL